MASYPSVGYTRDSERRQLSTRAVDVSAGGTVRVRQFASVEPSEFTLVHSWIDSTDRDTLTAFFAANETADDIALTWEDGTAYACAFAAPPTVRRGRGAYWHVVMHLIGAPS